MQSTDPELVSVIIPAYNRGKYLAQALDSVLAQDYRPIEIVVVDDGSTDNTAAVAHSYPEVRYIWQTNQGAPAARNTGLKNTTGKLIAFLDADDYWPSNKLALQSQYLTENPEIGCVIARGKNFLEDGIEKPEWLPESTMSADPPMLGFPGSLLHRWAFDRVGYLDERMRYGDDLDWFIRVQEEGIQFGFMSSILIYRRVHDTNLSHDQRAIATSTIRIIKSHRDRVRDKIAARISGVRE